MSHGHHKHLGIGALLLSVTVLILLIVSYLTNWYHVTLQVASFSAQVELSLKGQEWSLLEGTSAIWTNTETWTDSSAFPNVKQVYVDCALLFLVAFILYVLITLLLLGELSHHVRKRLSRCGTLVKFLVLGSILIATICLVIAALLLLKQPEAFEEDFHNYSFGVNLGCGDPCNSFSGNDGGFSWGPLAGWWMAVIAAILSVLLLILVFIKRRRLSGYERI